MEHTPFCISFHQISKRNLMPHLPFFGQNIGPHYISFVFRKYGKGDSDVTNKPSIHSTTQPVLCWKRPAINHSLFSFLCGLSNELVLSMLLLFMCVLLSFLECMCLSASIFPHQFVFRFGYMCICVVFVMRVCTYLHLSIACLRFGLYSHLIAC